MKVIEINLDLIEQNENSRVVYKEQDLSELMASMKQDGLLQPIGVRVIAGGKYDCVFGNRRLVAAKKLGWLTISAALQERTDEKERDILNLIENLKRQNTTVSEDGRMFDILLQHGLTMDEIAARLGVTRNRVETAIDVYKDFPKEFRSIIVNSATGKRNQAGRIPASTAFHVNNMRKSHKLTRKQTRQILNYARQDGVTTNQVTKIGPLVGAGMSIQRAIETVEKLSVISLSLLVDNAYIASVEKKHNRSFYDVVYDLLEKHLRVKRANRKSVNFKDPGVYQESA